MRWLDSNPVKIINLLGSIFTILGAVAGFLFGKERGEPLAYSLGYAVLVGGVLGCIYLGLYGFVALHPTRLPTLPGAGTSAVLPEGWESAKRVTSAAERARNGCDPRAEMEEVPCQRKSTAGSGFTVSKEERAHKGCTPSGVMILFRDSENQGGEATEYLLSVQGSRLHGQRRHN